MRISRETNIILNYFLNEIIPPFIRDRKWFTYIAFKILFKNKAHIFRDFHKNVYQMTDKEFKQTYADIQDVIIQRPTDINRRSIDLIKESIIGNNICDVGCGRGYLLNILSKDYQVTGIDVALDSSLQVNSDNVQYIESQIEDIKVEDSKFDTVICAHTLEHVRDIQKSIYELRIITKKRLIIILPCERPYYYTFNLHIHFFPYEYSVFALLGKNENSSLQKINGDWFYIEDIT